MINFTFRNRKFKLSFFKLLKINIVLAIICFPITLIIMQQVLLLFGQVQEIRIHPKVYDVVEYQVQPGEGYMKIWQKQKVDMRYHKWREIVDRVNSRHDERLKPYERLLIPKGDK